MARAAAVNALSEQTLNASVTTANTGLTMSASPGSNMPFGAGVFALIVTDGTPANTEVVEVTRTLVTDASVTITASGTFAMNHAAGVTIKYVQSALDFNNFARLDAANTFTIAGQQFAAGSVSTTSIRFGSTAGTGYYGTTTTLSAAISGVNAWTLSPVQMVIAPTVRLTAGGGLLVSKNFEISGRTPTSSAAGSPALAAAITSGQLAFDVDDATLFTNLNTSASTNTHLPCSILVGTEWMVCTSISGNTLTVVRGRFGTAAAAHALGDPVEDVPASVSIFDKAVIPTNGPPATFFAGTLAGNITIYVAPISTSGTWAKPASRYIYKIYFASLNTSTVTIKDGSLTQTIATQTGTGGTCPLTVCIVYDTLSGGYYKDAVLLG